MPCYTYTENSSDSESPDDCSSCCSYLSSTSMTPPPPISPIVSEDDIADISPVVSEDDIADISPVVSEDDIADISPVVSEDDIADISPVVSEDDIADISPVVSEDDIADISPVVSEDDIADISPVVSEDCAADSDSEDNMQTSVLVQPFIQTEDPVTTTMSAQVYNYKLVGDNIDFGIKVRYNRIDDQKQKLLHYFQYMCVRDRVNLSHLPIVKPDDSCLNCASKMALQLLPNKGHDRKLAENLAVFVSRIIVSYIPF